MSSRQTREVPKLYVGVREAAAMLSVNPATLYRLIETGELNAYRIGIRRMVIKVEELDAFLQARRTRPADSAPTYFGTN